MTDTLSSSGPTLGVVGGGQLGRMLAEAAAPLGIETVVLDPTPDCPAATVAREQIVGEFDDPDAIRRLAETATHLTFEIELADPDLLETVSNEADVPVHPSPGTLRMIQDKLGQNRHLRENDVPVPPFRGVSSLDELYDALDELGYPAMLKARTGGYDGRGNFPIESEADVESTYAAAPDDVLVEAFVDFERELSVVGVKGDDEIATFPVGENIHEEEILRETVVPARISDEVRERALSVAGDVLELLSGRGVFAVELFETDDGEILVNEIAPRPHNSGHYSIEGALTSQFEQHARAVTGRPLGATDLRNPVVSANILGDVDESQPAQLAGVDSVLSAPGTSLHWYGKHEVRPLRKMGHLTTIETDGESATELLSAARDLRDELTFDT